MVQREQRQGFQQERHSKKTATPSMLHTCFHSANACQPGHPVLPQNLCESTGALGSLGHEPFGLETLVHVHTHMGCGDNVCGQIRWLYCPNGYGMEYTCLRTDICRKKWPSRM